MVLRSKNAMHLYGIRLCVIDIKMSNKCKLEQKKSSIALVFQCKYVYCTTNEYQYIIDCVNIKYT